MPIHIIPTSELPKRPKQTAMEKLEDAYIWLEQANEEGDDYLPFEEVDRAARRVKMTEEQKREYALYRRACRVAGVEAVRADFLMDEYPLCVWQEMQQSGLKAMGTAAGQ